MCFARRSLLFLLCVLFSTISFSQIKEDWLPVTPQDLSYKEVPGKSGAAAVRLYYAHSIDNNSQTEFVYERIKILKDQGKEYADVKIPIVSSDIFFVTLSDLKARTIRPDGTVVDFTDKVYDTVIFKGQGLRVFAKGFTLPEVSVGSIIEYKYHLNFQVPVAYAAFVLDLGGDWVMQSDLFTVKENFYFRPFEGGVYQSTTHASVQWDGAQVSWVSTNLKDKPKSKGNEISMEMQNVPAFESEDHMPPEQNYKPAVIFFYTRRGISNTEKAWQDLGQDENERVELFLSRNKGVKEAALKAIADETEPGMKLRRIYERAQQIRNLSFEHFRTDEELKKENLQVNLGVGDVLSHGYGTERDITRLFVAMARAAGFDASILLTSDRKERFFNKEETSLRQINSMIASVVLDGKEMYLEPGTRFCPYGFVRWNHTLTDALKLDKKGGSFVKVPPSNYDKSVVHRTANGTVAEDGSLKAEVVIEYKGYDALEHRLESLDTDEAGKKKMLEDEVKEWLPGGSVVKTAKVDGWDGSDEPLVAHFNVEVPAYASVAGKRLLLPAYLFQVQQKEAFKHSDRKYPVYFPYPFTEHDALTLKTPAGLAVESVPEAQNASLGGSAKYVNISQFDGTQMMSERKLLFNGVFFPTEKYSEVKTFFNKVQTADQQQAILHGGSVSAQKGN